MRISGGERALTVLGYLPFMAPLLLVFKVRRDSMFVQFHVRQSWVLLLLWLALHLVLFILLMALPAAASVLLGIMFLSWIAYGFLMLAGMIKSGMGDRYRMPVVADVALLMRL